MNKNLTFIIFLIFLSTYGCGRKVNCVPYWETDEFWNLPVTTFALDSITEGRKHIISDNGKPYPVDEYEMCLYRGGKPQIAEIPLDSIVGTWHGYWHIYGSHTILTINPDSTYRVTSEDWDGYGENGNMLYKFSYLKSGKYTYNEEENRLTLLNYNSTETLTREAYMKKANPLHETRIIYSLERDTMWIFDGHCDFFPYFRPGVDISKASFECKF